MLLPEQGGSFFLIFTKAAVLTLSLLFAIITNEFSEKELRRDEFVIGYSLLQ